MIEATDCEKIYTRDEAGDFMRMSPAYLAKLASLRRGPRFTKFGRGCRSPVRYRASDLLAWMDNPQAHERAAWGSTAAKRNARRHKAGRR